MIGQNRRERVAALHKENIVLVAEHLFLDKGFQQATIHEISKLSGYSRKTIYAYFEGKEDILYHVTLSGLGHLQKDLITVIEDKDQPFLEKYQAICVALQQYNKRAVQPMADLNRLYQKEKEVDRQAGIAVSEILDLLEMIFSLLTEFVDEGKAQGLIWPDVESRWSVWVLWCSLSFLLDFVKCQGSYEMPGISLDEADFLQHGFHQIINGLLKEKTWPPRAMSVSS